MTYNVFGGTLSLTQSLTQTTDVFWCFVVFHLVLCVFLQCFDT